MKEIQWQSAIDQVREMQSDIITSFPAVSRSIPAASMEDYSELPMSTMSMSMYECMHARMFLCSTRSQTLLLHAFMRFRNSMQSAKHVGCSTGRQVDEKAG